MIGTLRYVIQQLSKDDSSFTIDMLIDEIVALEEKLDRNEKAVNELNIENRQLKFEMIGMKPLYSRRLLEEKVERYEKALEKIIEMESPFYHPETQSETPFNYARVALEKSQSEN